MILFGCTARQLIVPMFAAAVADYFTITILEIVHGKVAKNSLAPL